MSDKRIFEKLDKVNSKEEISFKIEYKGKVLHQKNIDIPEYAKEIMNDDDLQIYYFFKEMANKLEEKINEAHKKRVWDELNKWKKDGADKDAGTRQ